MISATLYLTACSTKNRMRRWLRRLREPRYLIGAVFAAGYFYFTFVLRMGGIRARRGGAPIMQAIPSFGGLAPLAAGAALLVAAAACWLLPASGRLLDFSDAEVQFLFPAPANRRSLLVHRLVRSQGGLLFASLVPALAFSIPAGSAVLAVRAGLAIWLVLVAARVYFSAIALCRSQLGTADARLRRPARLPLVLVLVALAIVVGAVARVYAAGGLVGFDEASERVAAALSVGMPRVVLWPFVALVRPFFAGGWLSYAAALAQSAAVALAAMIWLLATDGVFQGASAALVEGRQRAAGKMSYVARPAAWRLAPTGRPETAFVWKATMQMTRVVDRRVLTRVVTILIAMAALVVVSSRGRAVPSIAGVFAFFGAGYIVLLAPQILRLDMRQDLQHLDVMKTWPVRGAAIVRGEIAGPALALTCGAWLLMAFALLFSGEAFPRSSAAWRFGIAGGGALLGPALIFGQYTVQNGVAVLFPAWVPLGAGRPRGLDAMGQRLLMLGATWLSLIVMLLPGAAVSAVLWLAFYRFLGAGMLVVAGAVCAAAIALEILMTSEALGPAYDRLDLTGIERPD
jgi:ABC-2 type transport system permease protein